MAKTKVKPCNCVHLCEKYAQKGAEYAEDQATMRDCPHFQAQPPHNHGSITMIGHDGTKTVHHPAGIATACGRCKADCQSVAHTDDHGWVCDTCLAEVYC